MTGWPRAKKFLILLQKKRKSKNQGKIGEKSKFFNVRGEKYYFGKRAGGYYDFVEKLYTPVCIQ